MKRLFGVALLSASFLALGCGSNLGDSCENSWTCSPPCGDAAFAQVHPDLCPTDGGGARDTTVADDGVGSSDGGVDENTADEDSSVAIGDEGDAGTIEEPDVSVGADARDAGADGADGADAVVDAPSEEADVAPPCDGTALPSVNACVIADQYGIFVSPTGNDNNTGTKALPVRTIGHALSLAKPQSKRVYACDDGTGYTEAVTLGTSVDGVSLFGAFRCSDWMYINTTQRATVRSPNAAAPLPALTVRLTTQSILIENFAFTVPGATTPGASSIGAIIDTAPNVTLHNVNVTSGDGAPGVAGMPGVKGADGPIAHAQQQGLAAFCGPGAGISQPGGGWPAASVICTSQGGSGGTATNTFGTAGVPGIPQDNVTPPNNNNGGGTPSSSSGPGGPGGAGSPGNSGAPGTSANAVGTFTQAGYVAAPAVLTGGEGSPGQAGGGGGASNSPMATCVGASGGAGGMGGCGGLGGTGGNGGGASIALFVWSSNNVMLDGCILKAGNGGTGGQGGNGGAGGSGQSGASGGSALPLDGGMTIAAGGNGGPGGNGGFGGPGAGGNGGPSYALVYRGQIPGRANNPTLTPGQPGGRGQGGTSPATGSDAGTITGALGNLGASAAEFAVPTDAGVP